MKVLITGMAGFIGAHVAANLASRGVEVVGVDTVNDYYAPALKRERLAALCPADTAPLIEGDCSDPQFLSRIAAEHSDITHIAHLSAQAGVRYSLADPYSYVASNVMSQVAISEMARLLPRLSHIVYASSSSVYGDNRKTPYAETDRVDNPQSVYAATKRSAELIAGTYCSLYGQTQIGLRFFTVYGPWGRPDMAYFFFTRAILEGIPLPLYDNGRPERDFTYIDDIVAGTVAAITDHPIEAHHRLYNLGNRDPVPVRGLVRALEQALGREAIIENKPMPPGDVQQTCADITAGARDLGFTPRTSLAEGIARFVDWYRAHDGARFLP